MSGRKKRLRWNIQYSCLAWANLNSIRVARKQIFNWRLASIFHYLHKKSSIKMLVGLYYGTNHHRAEYEPYQAGSLKRIEKTTIPTINYLALWKNILNIQELDLVRAFSAFSKKVIVLLLLRPWSSKTKSDLLPVHCISVYKTLTVGIYFRISKKTTVLN